VAPFRFACAVAGLLSLTLGAPMTVALAQTPPAAPETPEAADPLEAEMMRARILARLGMIEEALAAYRALLERHRDNRPLREDYAELLVDAAQLDEAGPVVDRYLADDPTSARLRRLKARLDLARGAPAEAGRRLDTLSREQPRDAGIMADLAAAELGAGRWSRALELYGRILDADPENREIQASYREILLGRSPRVELIHSTLLQAAATHHVEEAAWRGWLADRWWLRAGARYGSYHQDRVVGQSSFSEEVWAGLATVGFQPTRAISLWAGLEESRRREDIYRTTGRLGGAYDDAKATTATVDVAIRELLANPLAALPRNGSTDRVTVDVARRVLVPVVLGAHYDFRHYRASGEDLGDRWEAAGRAELELVRSRVQVTLIPQVFFSRYTPTAGGVLREAISFIKREDVLGIGSVVGWDVTPALRLQAGAVGRRDLLRALTSWEVNGEGRWRIRPWLEGRVLYTRNTESTTVGGQEEFFLGRLDILY
jgi:tetratricopeptide (TPR) repeat protein